MSIGSERLEDALRTYEDLCLIQEARSSIYHFGGRSRDPNAMPQPKLEYGLANWRAMRKRLLNTQTMLGDQNWALHIAYTEEDSLHGLLWGYDDFPLDLHQWLHQSHRIFSLGSDLQSAFLKHNYSDLTWDQIVFPFSSFMIELEQPIMEGVVDKPAAFDTILVTVFPLPDENGQPNHQIKIRLFHKRNTDRKGVISQSDRQLLDRDIQRKQWHRLHKPMQRVRAKLREIELFPGYVQSVIYEKAVHSSQVHLEGDEFLANQRRLQRNVAGLIMTKTSAMSDTRFWSHYCDAAKIAVGLSLYLYQGSTVIQDEQRSPRGNGTIASKPSLHSFITDTAHVCTVLGKGVFDPKKLIRKSRKGLGMGREMPPHPRRPYMRRPRGQGNNPFAEKTVSVRKTYIHEDRKPKEGVIPGSRTEVK
jgi:hypothetical protein